MKFDSDLQSKDYAEAASLAFELRQPRRLLSVVSAAAAPALDAGAPAATSGAIKGAARGAKHLARLTRMRRPA